MTRTVFLAIFSNQNRPAHWSIWIPSDGQATKGKKIHVTGNPATGFFLEFKRNYDFASEGSRYERIEVCQVPTTIADIAPTLPETVDTTARDLLETAALSVKPPGRSANPFDPAAPNCQSWIFDYVEKLIEEQLIDEDVRAIVQSAPRRI